MRFGYAILYVEDVPATLAFYERAFGLARSMLHEDQYGEMDTGATKLAFAKRAFVATLVPLAFADSDQPSVAAPMEIGLVAEDVPAAFDRAVAAGAMALKAPAAKPWGQIVGYVRDCNGFIVELCSPMD